MSFHSFYFPPTNNTNTLTHTQVFYIYLICCYEYHLLSIYSLSMISNYSVSAENLRMSRKYCFYCKIYLLSLIHILLQNNIIYVLILIMLTYPASIYSYDSLSKPFILSKHSCTYQHKCMLTRFKLL